MDVTVTGRHVSVTPAMKDYARDKVLKCDKFRPTLTSAHIVMNVEKFRHKVEINVSAARHINVHVESISEDMYKSIDECIDKLTKQLRKFKGKVQHHKMRQAFKLEHLEKLGMIPPEEGAEEEDEEDRRPSLLHRQTLAKKPMSIDEAILEMKALNDDFYIFYNAKTQSPSVLYRITKERCGHLKGPVKKGEDGKVSHPVEVFSLKGAGNPDFRPKKLAEKKTTLEKISSDEIPVKVAKMKKNYLVFVNADTNQLNVLYRRRDGKVGLIE